MVRNLLHFFVSLTLELLRKAKLPVLVAAPGEKLRVLGSLAFTLDRLDKFKG